MRSERTLRAGGQGLIGHCNNFIFSFQRKNATGGLWSERGPVWLRRDRGLLAALLPIDWSRARVGPGRPARGHCNDPGERWWWFGLRGQQWRWWDSGHRLEIEPTGFLLCHHFFFKWALEESRARGASSVHSAQVEKFTQLFSLFYSWVTDFSVMNNS